MFGIMELKTGKVKGSDESIYKHEFASVLSSVDDFTWRQDISMHVAVPKEYINFWESGHRCEQEGCFKDGCVECHVPEDPMQLPPKDLENKFEHFCCDHAFENGYCICCGEFWGGIEDFDFGSGLCDNCKEAIDCEQSGCEEHEGLIQ